MVKPDRPLDEHASCCAYDSGTLVLGGEAVVLGQLSLDREEHEMAVVCSLLVLGAGTVTDELAVLGVLSFFWQTLLGISVLISVFEDVITRTFDRAI